MCAPRVRVIRGQCAKVVLMLSELCVDIKCGTSGSEVLFGGEMLKPILCLRIINPHHQVNYQGMMALPDGF